MNVDSYNELKKSLYFYNNVYNIYIKGGYRCLVYNNVLCILMTAFLHMFMIWVIFLLDWSKIFTCTDEDMCINSSYYLIQDISGIKLTLLTIFTIILIFHWIWLLIFSIKEILISDKYYKYFNDYLELDANNLHIYTWTEVVKTMVERDESLTPHIIVSEIMRKENYWIALVSNNIFEIRKTFYSNYLEWMINLCFLKFILKGKSLDRTFLRDIRGIKMFMKVIGIITLLLSPFIFCIMFVNCIIKCITDFYTKKMYFGPKDWSNYAKIIFREYNELDHIFDRRMDLSYKYASKYENRFASNSVQIIINFLIGILGAFLSISLLVAFYDERVLLYMDVFGRNLLWYVTIFTTLIALGRITLKENDYVEKSHDQLMKDIAEYTYYYPDDWHNRSHETLKKFYELYNYRVMTLFRDLLGIFVVPVLMIFVFPHKVHIMTNFIVQTTVEHDHIGDMCKFCNFDEEDYHEIANELLSSQIVREKIRSSMNHFRNNYESF